MIQENLFYAIKSNTDARFFHQKLHFEVIIFVLDSFLLLATKDREK